MNDIRKIDLTRSLPPSLKTDEAMLALANVIGGELQKNVEYAELTTIYARIHELDEDVLDVLAYDLHVDWYDYSYPIEAKRAMIKDSVKVHKRLGTKFAVETALGSLHPNSEIEEWFEYGGRPFFFRVILDTTNSRVAAEYFEIKKAVNSYKRLSAHMEDLIYQCTVNLTMGIETKLYNYKTGIAGKMVSGTWPQRQVVGVAEELRIELENELEGFEFESRLAGTSPRRSRIAVLTENEIEAAAQGEGFGHTSAIAGRVNTGVEPQRQIAGKIEDIELELAEEVQSYIFTSQITGTGSQRNTSVNLNPGGISPELTATSYKYKYNLCGMIVSKSK